MGIRALIIEDEPLARDALREFAGEFENLEIVGEAHNGTTAVSLIDDFKPALVFLDVQLPEISGLEVLRRAQHKCAVVFTTAFDQHAVRAFELEAFDYLLKPFGRARFREMFERVGRRLLANAEVLEQKLVEQNLVGPPSRRATENEPPLTRLFVRERDLILPVQICDIIRLEADDDYTIVYVNGKKHLVGITLHEFECRLDPQSFRRVHRSHIVNLDQIETIEVANRRLLLRMIDKSLVATSRAGATALKDLIA